MAPGAANKRKDVMPNNMSYVKLGLHMLNADLSPNEKKYTAADLKEPTAALVQKIFISALGRIYGLEAFSQGPPQELVKFNNHVPGSYATYDDSVDNIYRHLIKSVPANSDMIDYAILLDPMSDIRRTYQAIGYTVAYSIYSDKIQENFVAVSDELTNENQVKIDLCREIEDIREKCSEEENKITMSKLEIPVLEAKFHGIREVIQSLEEENDQISKEMLHDQKLYEQTEKENKQLVDNISRLEKTKIALEDQIVKSPEEFLKTFQDQKEALEVAKKLRSKLSSKLEHEVVSDQMMHNVIDMGERCISSFDELVNIINAEESRVTEVSAFAKDIHELDKEVDAIQQAISKMNSLIKKRSTEEQHQSSTHKEKVALINLHVQELKSSKAAIESAKEDIMLQVSGRKQLFNDLTCKIKDIRASIQAHEHYVGVTLASIKNAGREQLKALLLDFNQSIMVGRYARLNGE